MLPIPILLIFPISPSATKREEDLLPSLSTKKASVVFTIASRWTKWFFNGENIRAPKIQRSPKLGVVSNDKRASDWISK